MLVRADSVEFGWGQKADWMGIKGKIGGKKVQLVETCKKAAFSRRLEAKSRRAASWRDE